MSNYKIVKFIDNEFEIDVRTDIDNDTVWLSQEQIAKLFGKELGQLVADLHKSEKEKLFNFISERPFDITMNSPHFKELPLSKQESIKRTKQRFYDQTTAAGIMALFEDSYFLNMGKPIKNELDKYNLPTFESVMDKVIDFYYFGKKDE